jgi:hypothetical protein
VALEENVGKLSGTAGIKLRLIIKLCKDFGSPPTPQTGKKINEKTFFLFFSTLSY